MTTRHERLLQGTPSDPVARKKVLAAMSTAAVKPAISYASRASAGVSKPTALYRPVVSTSSIGSSWKFDLNEKDVNLESRGRTAVLNLRGPRAASTSLEDVLAALTANGVDAEDVISIFKAEDQRQVQLTFLTKQGAESLLSMPTLSVSEFVSADVGPVRSDYHEIRVHWVPDYVKDSFFRDIFSRVGKVLSVVKNKEKTGRTGCVRVVKLQADWKDMECVPHLMAIRFEGAIHRFLLTIPGRPPLCLLCSEVGHVKKDCPRSPAAVAAREAKEAQQLAASLLAAAKDDADSDSDDNDDDNAETKNPAASDANPAIDPPAITTPVTATPATDTPAATKPTVTDTSDPTPSSIPTPLPTSPKSVTVGQFDDHHDDGESSDTCIVADTQATTSWAEEMDAEEFQDCEEKDSLEIERDSSLERGDSDQLMCSLEEDSSQASVLLSSSSIPCAQPEKHGLAERVVTAKHRLPSMCVQPSPKRLRSKGRAAPRV